MPPPDSTTLQSGKPKNFIDFFVKDTVGLTSLAECKLIRIVVPAGLFILREATPLSKIIFFGKKGGRATRKILGEINSRYFRAVWCTHKVR